MKAFKAPAKKRVTTLCLPSRMLDDLDQAVLSKHSSIRFRSRWICEAISNFFEMPRYEQHIADEWIERGNNGKVIVTLDPPSIEKIERIENEIQEKRKLKDIQSAVIRAAIIQKLIDMEFVK